ncbi:PorT family protein [Flavobacterium algicola]|uniref:PorT family protein n=1 Tax=Flavobacterium algicola TaxID=556529 RepID=UPI001EFEAAE8|nr:PorT family protein [Flavobacterium algicola]MCG9793615.1 PorT family protein [Flavobacterium algicola]
MKKQYLLILFLLIYSISYSQITFEKGYFITTNGEKVICQIKNLDWMNSPSEFEYRLSEIDQVKKATIQTVKEFSIDNFSKYVRSYVGIDRSSNKINELSEVRSAILEEEELFLKVLIEGEASLYRYNSPDIVRFFYTINDSKIEQLIFKLYKFNTGEFNENNEYRQQLLLKLKCEKITEKDFKYLEYDEKELKKLFIKYNQCRNKDFKIMQPKEKKDLFNLTLRPRFNFSSFKLSNFGSTTGNIDYGNNQTLGFGIESEIIFGFNKNKWSLILEPTYQYFKSQKEVYNFKTSIDYKSIELPIGIRYYMFLNENSKLFLNGAYVIDFSLNSELFRGGEILDISNAYNFAFGIGYKIKDRYSVEFRMQTARNLQKDYVYYTSSYQQASMILGYTLF